MSTSTLPPALLARLEAVASRLESYANTLGGAATSSSSTSSSSSSSSSTPGVEAYRAFYASSVQPFIDACKSQDGLAQIAVDAESGFQYVGVVLEAASVSKKPSDAALMKFLDPLVQIINRASSFNDNRSEYFNQFKAWTEMSTGGLSWFLQAPPRPFVQDQLEAADFYLIKVLTAAKQKGEAYGKFASAAKDLLKNLQPFITANYATGLEWNPKGADLNDFKPAAASSASSAVPPPPGPPAAPSMGVPPPPGPPCAPGAPSTSAPAKPTTSGMGAVFGELTSKDVTSGLRKVTSDMKTKNRKDEPALEVKAKAAPAPAVAAPKATEVKKEAALYLSKGTWFVEYQENNPNVVLPDEVQLKESIYILKCKNSTIHIPVKCKSIQVDSCVKCEIVFKSVVSLVEVFNSQRVKVECEESVPSMAIDKAAGVSVILSRQAVQVPPTLITSNITEANLVVPGKTDEDDPIEIPLPEQYTTSFDPSTNKLHTEAVAHSAN